MDGPDPGKEAELAERPRQPPSPTPWRWALAKASVRGAQHQKDGRVNQDGVACEWLADLNAVIAVVSDGHGSARCFRSDIGSSLAASVAVRVVSKVLGGAHDLEAVAAKLPQMLVGRWSQAVIQHLEEHPYPDDELGLLQPLPGAALREDGSPAMHMTLPYGATLAIAAVTPSHCLLAQLGDGKIMVLHDGESAPAIPLPDDAGVSALDTFSLCMPDAAKHFRCTITRLVGTPPRLILTTTDGYPDSFRTEQDFLQVGIDLGQAIRQRGLAAVEQDLPRWLDESSRGGSGDDCSLALIWRDDLEPAR